MESEGKYKESGEFYKRAAAESAEGDIALAEFYMRRQESGKALETIDSAILKTASRPDVRIYKLKGRLLLSLGREEEAVETFEEMERLFPGTGLPLVVRTYLKKQDTKQALKRLQEALKENPERVELKADLSRIYWMSGQREKALRNAELID